MTPLKASIYIVGGITAGAIVGGTTGLIGWTLYGEKPQLFTDAIHWTFIGMSFGVILPVTASCVLVAAIQ